MGLLDTLNSSRKGLSAATSGVQVVSNNVANASTVGYSRRSLTTATSDPVERRGVLFGQGVDVSGIVRSHDRYLGMRLIDAVGDQARSNTAEESLRLTESWFNESQSTGLVESYNAFLETLNRLTQDPSDVSLRTAAVHAADNLATTTSRAATGLTATISDMDSSFSTRFTEVNNLLTEIAALNKTIGRSSDTTGNADLLDRRDQLIRDIAALAGATAELETDGQATVFLNGHAAVSGGEARAVTLVTAAGAPPAVYLAADAGTINITSGLGGALGGLLDARAYTEGYLDRLDDFAFTLANSLNTAHAAGFDAYGAAGADIFVPPAALAGAAAALALDPNLDADASLFALSATAGVVGDDGNLQNLLNFETATPFTGALTGQEFLSSLLTEVGADLSAVSADADARDAMVEDFDAMRTSVSGVDPDEEAMKLIEYQAAYRAAARVVTATDEMLRILTSLGA